MVVSPSYRFNWQPNPGPALVMSFRLIWQHRAHPWISWHAINYFPGSIGTRRSALTALVFTHPPLKPLIEFAFPFNATLTSYSGQRNTQNGRASQAPEGEVLHTYVEYFSVGGFRSESRAAFLVLLVLVVEWRQHVKCSSHPPRCLLRRPEETRN